MLLKLIEKHNAKFAVETEDDTPTYRLLEKIDLTYVFTVREQRQIGSGQTLSFSGKLYTQDVLFRTRTVVKVRETMAGEVVIFQQGHVLPLRETQKTPRKTVKKTKKASAAPSHKPAKNPLGRTKEQSKFSIAQSYAASSW